ncbi:MAG: ABC transporter substrate-binding protein [Myxococcota bacterium]
MGDLGGRRRVAGACALAVFLVACGGAPQRRVISLSPATTRVAQALGLGDRLESLDPGAPDAIDRAFKSGANLALAASDTASTGVRAAFASRNIPVRAFAPKTTEEVVSAYTEIATVLGQPKAAAALIAQVTRELAPAGPDGARPKVALVLSRKPLQVVAGGAFLSHLLELAGVQNVFGEEKQLTLVVLPEQLVARKPDRVLDVSQELLGSAWIDPVGTAESLRSSLAAGG